MYATEDQVRQWVGPVPIAEGDDRSATAPDARPARRNRRGLRAGRRGRNEPVVRRAAIAGDSSRAGGAQTGVAAAQRAAGLAPLAVSHRNVQLSISAGARAYLVAITVWAIPCFGLARESWALFSVPMAGHVPQRHVHGRDGDTGGIVVGIRLGLRVGRGARHGQRLRRDPKLADLAFFDWFLEALYLFNGLWVSVLPGMGIAWWLAISGQQGYVVRGASLFFFLPIVLLSMLERGSFMSVISLPVCRTFATAWRGWASFYLATACC